MTDVQLLFSIIDTLFEQDYTFEEIIKMINGIKHSTSTIHISF